MGQKLRSSNGGSNSSLFSDVKRYGDDQYSDPGLLTQQISRVQGPLPQCLSPDSGKMCREGHSFLVFFLLEHMTKIRLSGLLIFVLFV